MVTIITITATDSKFGLFKIIIFLVRTNKKVLYRSDTKNEVLIFLNMLS